MESVLALVNLPAQHMLGTVPVSMNFTNIIIRQVFTETAQFMAVLYLE